MNFPRRLKYRRKDLSQLLRRSLRLERLDPRCMLAGNNLFFMDPAMASADVGPSPDAGAAVAASASAAAASSNLVSPDQSYSVNIEDRIVAFYDMGGTPNQPAHCRRLAFALCSTNWQTVIANHIQPDVNKGIKRLILSMPFGQRSWVESPPGSGNLVAAPGQVNFQFDAYLDAHNEVPNQNATKDFVPAWQNFFATNRAAGRNVDAIVYIGSPRHDPNQTALINTESAWWDRAYDIVLPLLRAGFRSIGFDASARTLPGTLDYKLLDILRYPELRDPVRDARLISLVGNERIEVYLEAVPIRLSERTDFPLTVIDTHFMIQDPTRPGDNNEHFGHDEFTGEIIRILFREQWQPVTADGVTTYPGIVATETILDEGHTASASTSFFFRPQNNGDADNLEEFVDLLYEDLAPAIPTLIDLDPDDKNPDTAEYQIITGPDHGQLTPHGTYGDVFFYTPDPGYAGEDSFRYAVSDEPSGQVGNGQVTLYVNVPPPVVEPQGPGRRHQSRRSRGD
jgi:hypothetical protein